MKKKHKKGDISLLCRLIWPNILAKYISKITIADNVMNIISLCQCQTGKRMNIQKNEVQIYVVMDAEKEKESGVGWVGGRGGVWVS